MINIDIEMHYFVILIMNLIEDRTTNLEQTCDLLVENKNSYF